MHFSIPRRLALAAVLATAITGPALAQTWPERPIRIVVGFAPGGSQGGEIIGGSAAEFAAFLPADTAAWGRLIKEANVKVD